MNKKTEKALCGSIRKWERIVIGTGEDEGVDNCPLCTLFFERECNGCPVADATGRINCNGSPYVDWHMASEVDSINFCGVFSWGQALKVIGPETMKVAIAEHDFLVGLLPENTK